MGEKGSKQLIDRLIDYRTLADALQIVRGHKRNVPSFASQEVRITSADNIFVALPIQPYVGEWL